VAEKASKDEKALSELLEAFLSKKDTRRYDRYYGGLRHSKPIQLNKLTGFGTLQLSLRALPHLRLGHITRAIRLTSFTQMLRTSQSPEPLGGIGHILRVKEKEYSK
jgi:hypothetical protein